MRIQQPDFACNTFLNDPIRTYVRGARILPAGNIYWWCDNEGIAFIWEVPSTLSSHGWWINSMILTDLSMEVATHLPKEFTLDVTETTLMTTQPDGVKGTIAFTKSVCKSDVTRGYIRVKYPIGCKKDPEPYTQIIAPIVCQKFYNIANFHSIYPRTIHDNF